jgi:hypothetical protein
MRASSSSSLLVALCVAALAACQPKTLPMTTEETERIQAMTARMTTRCVGRYLLDLPEKFVLNSQSRAEIEDVTLEVQPMDWAKFEVLLEARRRELEQLMQPGRDRNRPHLRRSIPLATPSAGAVFDHAKSRTSSDRSGRTLEVFAWRDGFRIVATVKATDLTFPEDADDSIAKQLKSDVAEKLTHLLSVYERVRGRKDNEIPVEQGVCFANGFVQGPPSDKERIDMHHHLDGVEDVTFSYHYLSDMGPQTTTLLQRGNEIEANLVKVNGKTLRKGSRRGQDVEFDEWLLQRNSAEGTMLYDYTLEMNSKEGNAAKPLFVLDFTSGAKHPRPPLTLDEAAVDAPVGKASLGAAPSTALWDKVTATLRSRPGAF